jgi:hypothetical protein
VGFVTVALLIATLHPAACGDATSRVEVAIVMVAVAEVPEVSIVVALEFV